MPVQLKFSRVVALTNVARIPGFKVYADNPSQVAIIAAMTEDQKEMLRSEGRGATVELKHATIGSGGRIFESALRVSA